MIQFQDSINTESIDNVLEADSDYDRIFDITESEDSKLEDSAGDVIMFAVEDDDDYLILDSDCDNDTQLDTSIDFSTFPELYDSMMEDLS